MRLRELRRDARRRRRDSVFAQLERRGRGRQRRRPVPHGGATGAGRRRAHRRGVLRASPKSTWRAEQIYPPAADAYARLRASLDLPPAPEIAVVCGWGHIDPDHPVLRSRALVLTSDRGVTRLENRLPDTARSCSLGRQLRFTGDVIIDALRARGHRRILSEAGPHTFGTLLRADRVDELFLTTSPFLAGDAGEGSRLRLVEGADLVPLARRDSSACAAMAIICSRATRSTRSWFVYPEERRRSSRRAASASASAAAAGPDTAERNVGASIA